MRSTILVLNMSISNLILSPQGPQPLPSGGLEWQGFVPLNVLIRAGLLQPDYLASARQCDLERDPTAMRIALARASIQRPFDAPRMKNAVKYRDYLIGMRQGKISFCPSVVIFCERATVDEKNNLIIPPRTPLFAVDGETQLQARFMMMQQFPETADIPFKITVIANEPEEFAKITLVDLNTLGNDVKKAITVSLDPRGPVIDCGTRAVQLARLDPDLHIHRFSTGGRKVAGRPQISAGIVGATIDNMIPWAKQFDQLNTDGIEDETSCIKTVASLLEESVERSHPLRRADPHLWQAAAAAKRKGRENLNYQSAIDAVAKMKQTGKRLNSLDRLSLYANSL